MKLKTNCRFCRLRCPRVVATLILFLLIGAQIPCQAQQTVGAITGTVLDSSGATVGEAVVKAHNVATNLEVTVHSKSNGSYSIPNLPVGTYELRFTKEGFETETHTQVLVTSDRTTTIDGALKVGAVSTTVEVTAVALMNQTDATNGYVVDQATIQITPLGTGSFTQLAILTPGVHADFLEGSGSNAGLGNQAIFANGNRDTSNSFSLNGVGTNNLFNGTSTSSLGENRFVLNTGENFGVGGEIQTNSVYGAIGQSLPTPPTDAIQEVAVNAAMFDATQGNNSGAHISVLTKSGTNQIHGTAWEQWQNNDMNAAPFFYNASPALTTKIPFVNRNQFGAHGVPSPLADGCAQFHVDHPLHDQADEQLTHPGWLCAEQIQVELLDPCLSFVHAEIRDLYGVAIVGEKVHQLIILVVIEVVAVYPLELLYLFDILQSRDSCLQFFKRCHRILSYSFCSRDPRFAHPRRSASFLLAMITASNARDRVFVVIGHVIT